MQKRTVYILDDELGFLSLLSDIGKACGLHPRCYTRAQHFFDQTQTFEAGSILILDLDMPDMDGIEVMRRLSGAAHPPALILISGHDAGILKSAEKLGRAHQLNIMGTLTKPVALHKLRKLMKANVSPSLVLPCSQEALRQPDELTPAQVRHAIESQQLVLHYQPQYDLQTGLIVGAEALVRWNHPTRGLLAPQYFIPIAERCGLMNALTHWVIDEAVQQERTWSNMGLRIDVSVNISASDITSLTLPEHLSQLLAVNRLEPTRLKLEITENTLMGELVTSLDILTRLRLKGIGLSIDDFGTGYSSLLQLHRVPFNELKIDRSFVANIPHDQEAQAIVKTCIMLGHELNMRVVAEGIETQEQFNVLRSYGCDIGQGFLLGKPAAAGIICKLACGQEGQSLTGK